MVLGWMNFFPSIRHRLEEGMAPGSLLLDWEQARFYVFGAAPYDFVVFVPGGRVVQYPDSSVEMVMVTIAHWFLRGVFLHWLAILRTILEWVRHSSLYKSSWDGIPIGIAARFCNSELVRDIPQRSPRRPKCKDGIWQSFVGYLRTRCLSWTICGRYV
ncbi:hypothetical protein M501DRAFT_1000218 [Patellaria atrata CBS 101060]|uniref:Uncharacterized protein n=1 Tax=Patellaria atrata CBS 101060 TaxID=1346257 RepID=A0A9P4S1H9_9PEZI|nr:hypothetical protein M501DRAFT_1000218 [Patellaria atrata CBS 101060]